MVRRKRLKVTLIRTLLVLIWVIANKWQKTLSVTELGILWFLWPAVSLDSLEQRLK